MASKEENDIKPDVDKKEATRLALEIFGLEASSVSEFNAYDDRNFHILASKSNNPFIQPVSSDGYILKITNSVESKNISFFEAQTDLLLHLKDQKLTAPTPRKNISGIYISVQSLPKKNEMRNYVVRLLDFQPGKILNTVPGSKELYFQVGLSCARLDVALKTFHHTCFDTHEAMWHLKSAPQIKSYLNYVQNVNDRALVAEIIDKLETKIMSRWADLEKGIIHGDINEQNIIVAVGKDGKWEVSSIIDFGDVNYSCYLFEIAATMAYMMLDGPRSGLKPLDCGAAVLEGVQTLRPLTSLEHSLLKIAICSRLCQSLVLGLYSGSLQPDNSYILTTQTNGWAVLKLLWNTPDSELARIWQKK